MATPLLSELSQLKVYGITVAAKYQYWNEI